jgi:hypothetical protein
MSRLCLLIRKVRRIMAASVCRSSRAGIAAVMMISAIVPSRTLRAVMTLACPW